MRRASRVLAFVAAASAVSSAACFHSSLDFGPAPSQTPTPPASPTPTSTPTGGLDFGDGADGDLDVSTDVLPNVCHGLVSASGTSATVTTSGGFTAGRRVLFLQVQDAVTAPLGDGSPVTNFGSAGLFEIRRVTALTPTTLTLGSALTNSYATLGAKTAEVCSLPEFAAVHVLSAGKLHAPNWDGSVGGVLAFFAQSLQIDAGAGGPGGGGFLSATGRGFRGGQLAPPFTVDHYTMLDVALTDGSGGGKGEGLDATSWTRAARGNLANGAGGGNGNAAGGGGGGAAGAGGSGSSEYVNVAGGVNTNTRGMPGASIVVPSGTARLLMGGAGGAGQHDTGTQGAGGGGGGVIWLSTGALSGAGSIRASGFFGQRSTSSGGGGGGGAGGTVVVITGDSTGFTGAVDASGGNGGDSQTQDGPGGGGAGGWIYYSGMPSGFTYSLAGGTPGTETAVTNSPRDATAGQDGHSAPVP
ncbi:MAG TPA: hypothetical protein VMV18_12055 [bacterium]|nr:hypothetical protein [bacterium]